MRKGRFCFVSSVGVRRRAGGWSQSERKQSKKSETRNFCAADVEKNSPLFSASLSLSLSLRFSLSFFLSLSVSLSLSFPTKTRKTHAGDVDRGEGLFRGVREGGDEVERRRR